MVGTGLGARRGILIKNGEALERGKKIDVVVFDKTGTLTEGKPKVVDILTCKATMSADELLALAASVERFSEHPLAQAIVLAARDKNLPFQEVHDFVNLAGKGVQARIGDATVMVGSIRLLLEYGVPLTHNCDTVDKHEADGKTIIAVAYDHRPVGVIAVADSLKEGARAAIECLRSERIATVMITGDNRRTAEAIAKEIGIDRVFAEVLPQDKAEHVRELQKTGRRVAFVGDGINDAPALVQADLGIAIGTGTDIAIESADIVLMSGDLGGVVNAIALSKATIRNISQNLFWAFVYNVALIPVAAGVLYPLSGTLLSPMLAAGAMALSSVFVLTNALRLRRFRAPIDDRPKAGPLSEQVLVI